MKEIKDKIYAMFDDGMPEVTDQWADDLGHSIAHMMKDRLVEKHDKYKLRLSSLGQGNRKLWYSVRADIPKASLRPEVRIKFLYGDIIELVYIALIRLAGYDVTHEQEQVAVEGIQGHIDCLIDGVLYDIKSASTFSFAKFKDESLHENDPFGYYHQLAGYTEGISEKLGKPIKPEGWMVMDKTLGHLCFSRVRESFMPDIRARAIEVKELVKEEQEPEPCAYPVPDGKSGNMKLATVCSYCDFKEHCWRDSNGGHGLRKFVYSTGIKCLTNVAKLPKVPEQSSKTRG